MRANEAHQAGELGTAASLRRFQILTTAIFIWSVALLALGTIVATTNAADGCVGWPLCNGEAAPPSDTAGFINAVHRLGGMVLAGATGVLALLSFLKLRGHSAIIRLTAGIFAIVLGQSVFGGYGVAVGFPGWATSVHVAAALLVVVALLTAIIAIQRAISSTTTVPNRTKSTPSGVTSLAAFGAIALFLMMVTGASAGAANGALTCDGLADCSTELIDQAGSATGAAGVPVITGIAGTLSIGGLFLARRRVETDEDNTIGRLALTAGAAGVTAVMAAMVFVATGTTGGAWAIPAILVLLAWLCLCGVVVSAGYGRIGTVLSDPAHQITGIPYRTIARDFARVTKPGIMLLLLTTTFGGMLVAVGGWPGTGLVLITLLGGAMASGGASAMNCYFDRDIDQIMARTRKRPIPLGSLTANQVRTFALTLSFLAVFVLAVFVNPLAALLALGGNLFYILVYTVWLKRSTPQNIVIGGAAGSFPPLVGWAAATGSLSLTALLIAAIIFYWTPPHFWSLALLKANDYRRANIPMLPVTHGEQTTRRFILLYSLLLVAITLLVVPAGPAGVIYLGAAVLFGGWFIALAARMYRENTSRLAWRLFKFSNYYLALVLAAMVVDRILIT